MINKYNKKVTDEYSTFMNGHHYSSAPDFDVEKANTVDVHSGALGKRTTNKAASVLV